MMTCQNFRANLQPGAPDTASLEHLRRCDACLDFAVQVDADNFFRAIGGEDRVPPGGVDAFVDDVMAQVRLRDTAVTVERRTTGAWRRMAFAAALATALIGGTLAFTHEYVKPAPMTASLSALGNRHSRLRTDPTVTKLVVETYQSTNATIVEVPLESKDDVQMVMIFDESLPADL